MKKKVVLGIVAGVSVVGGIAGLVISSVKRLHKAKKYYEEADKLVDKAQDMMYEVDDLLERAQELTELFDEELDEDYEEVGEIVEFPKGDK